MTYLQMFSAGYLIAPEIEVRAYGGGNAVVAHDLYEDLQSVVGFPVFASVSGVHYEVRPEHGVPADTLALPERRFPSPHHEGDSVLIERPTFGGWFA